MENSVNNTQKKSKGPIIVIILLLLALLGACGYILYDKGIIFGNITTNTNNQTTNNNDNNNSEQKNETKDEEKPSYEISKNQGIFGSLDVSKDSDSAEIMMNGKKHTLSQSNDGKNLILSFDEKKLLGPIYYTSWVGIYHLFTANDNKQYLFIEYEKTGDGGHAYIIIDDTANIIKEITYNMPIIVDLPFIKDGNIYYYSREHVSPNEGICPGKVNEVKISINNGKFTEELTGIDGYAYSLNC